MWRLPGCLSRVRSLHTSADVPKGRSFRVLQSALVALGAMLLSLVPAQTKQVSQAATSSAKRAAPAFGMSTGDDAC